MRSVDTCDQDTNPQCLPGSLNYDPTRDGINPYTNKAISHNVNRENRCAADPNRFYCTVRTVACEGNVEVLSYYDGAQPVRPSPRFCALRVCRRFPASLSTALFRPPKIMFADFHPL